MQREFFAHTCFVLGGESGARYFMFCFAMQQPQYVGFCEVRRLEYHMPTGLSSFGDWPRIAAQAWEH
eukprot:9047227-Lingulodinium_polyedra.AAC.1